MKFIKWPTKLLIMALALDNVEPEEEKESTNLCSHRSIELYIVSKVSLEDSFQQNVLRCSLYLYKFENFKCVFLFSLLWFLSFLCTNIYKCPYTCFLLNRLAKLEDELASQIEEGLLVL